MNARSFVLTITAVDDRVGDLLAESRLSERAVREQGLANLAALSDFTQCLQSGLPLPITPDSPPGDDGIIDAVRVLYDDHDLSAASLSEDVCSQLRDAGRISFAGDRLVVPLADDAAGRYNWSPVLRFLFDRLETIRKRGRRVRTRVERTFGENVVETRVWATFEEMVAETCQLLRRVLSTHAYLSGISEQPDDGSERFGTWAVEQLT